MCFAYTFNIPMIGYWELANTFGNSIGQYILIIRIYYIEKLSIYAVFIHTFIANDDSVFSCLFFIYFSVFTLHYVCEYWTIGVDGKRTHKKNNVKLWRYSKFTLFIRLRAAYRKVEKFSTINAEYFVRYFLNIKVVITPIIFCVHISLFCTHSKL